MINLINMDGIEWRREKWGFLAKSWFWLNERFGCWFGDHLIADHPEIKAHLATRVSVSKITMIPYGAEEILDADEGLLAKYDIRKGNYSVLIARPEPENSVYEIVAAFSEKKRNHKLVVLGNYSAERNAYHRKVLFAASNEVLFIGAVYDKAIVNALRFYARYYFHGHRVGGTNPSLVEALGAGSAVIAHDNKFNRWVAGDAGIYFSDTSALSLLLCTALSDNEKRTEMASVSRKIFKDRFTWDKILGEYEALLLNWCERN